MLDALLCLPEIREINENSNLPVDLGRYISKGYEESILMNSKKVCDNSYHFLCGNCIVFTNVEAGQRYIAEIHMAEPCKYNLFTINRNNTFEEAEKILIGHGFWFDKWNRYSSGTFVKGRVVIKLSLDSEYGKITKIVICCN